MRIDFEILGMKGFNPGKINLRPRKVIEICFWEKVLTLPLIHELSPKLATILKVRGKVS